MSDHLPMAATGITRLDRFWACAQTFAVFEAIAADAQAEAERAAERAADAAQRADDARLEMLRAFDALTLDERSETGLDGGAP